MDCDLVDPDGPYNQTAPTIYTVQAVLLSVMFPVSLIGVIMNFVFICRKKTNFLVRRIVYVTVPTTLQLGGYWTWSVTAFMPLQLISTYCNISASLYSNVVSLTVQTLLTILVCSISISLYIQVCKCNCCRCCSRHNRRNPTRRQLVCLEVIFVSVVFGVSLLTGILSYYYSFQVRIVYGLLLLIPFPALLSFFGNVVLLVWLCCQRIQIPQRVTVAKEIGVFFLLSLVTAFVWTSVFLSGGLIFQPSFVIPEMVLLTLASLFPVVVFVYMYFSFRRTTRRHVRFVRADNGGQNIQTDYPRTSPESTRVSLPTDTAAHAPNFLSPSTAEPSEVTPLIN